MIYLFFGDNATSAKKKIRKLTEALISKKPDALHFYFDDRSLDNEFIKSIFQSTGLFAEHHIVVLDRTYGSLESKDLVKDMKKSSHVFILFEENLQKKDLDYLKKHSEKFEEFKGKEKVKNEDRSKIFKLTDALGSRDRKRLWSLYREYLEEDGLPLEREIFPMLFWQIKGMLAIKNSKNAKEAGLKPFVFSKNKRYVEKYSQDDLRDLSRRMVKALVDSRRGKDLENEIEKLILTI